MQTASKCMGILALVVSGKNPNIICAGADFDTGVDQALGGVCYHAGRCCSSGTRLIVEASNHDKFVEALVKRVGNIKLGSGFDEATEMGPLISKEHLEKVTNYVNNGIKEGATLAVGGDQPENPALANGFFYLPTVLTNCTTDM